MLTMSWGFSTDLLADTNETLDLVDPAAVSAVIFDDDPPVARKPSTRLERPAVLELQPGSVGDQPAPFPEDHAQEAWNGPQTMETPEPTAPLPRIRSALFDSVSPSAPFPSVPNLAYEPLDVPISRPTDPPFDRSPPAKTLRSSGGHPPPASSVRAVSAAGSPRGERSGTLPVAVPLRDANTNHQPATVSATDADPRAESHSPLAAESLIERYTSPGQFESTFRTYLLLAIVSLAPAVLLMTTSYVRISVVLGLLRQALGYQLLPSNQVVTSLAMFLTILIMAPVWQQIYRDAIVPYTEQKTDMTAEDAWEAGIQPAREFMSHQISNANNDDDVLLFYDHLPGEQSTPNSYDDVPLQILLPAFMISELKTAFLIGFQIFLPFLVLDIVVSSVTVSMGMMMLPPATVSLPLKLLLFVMVDGWDLVVGMLIDSFGMYM